MAFNTTLPLTAGTVAEPPPPLLTDAELCLLAAHASAANDVWRNLGRQGSTLDARIVDPPTYLTTDDPGGPGYRKTVPTPGPPPPPGQPPFALSENRMFDIPGATLAPTAYQPWTCTIAFTPLYVNPTSVRFLWKYAASSLPGSTAGLVFEDVARFEPAPGGTSSRRGFIAAIYDGKGTFLGGTTPDMIQQTKQVATVRYALPTTATPNGEVSVWRNGAAIVGVPPASVVGDGPWIDDTRIRIGAGQICHAVLWHARALTDTEIAEVSRLLLGA